jgi:hypothetical protein
MDAIESDQRGGAGEICAFIANAFRQERLRQDIDALFRWISELPKDLDLSAERAVLSQARTMIIQAVRESRRNQATLASQVATVARYTEEAGPGPVRGAEPAWRAPPAEQSLFGSTQSARRAAPASERTADLVKLDLERAFQSLLESNVESNIGDGAARGNKDSGEQK